MIHKYIKRLLKSLLFLQFLWLPFSVTSAQQFSRSDVIKMKHKIVKEGSAETLMLYVFNPTEYENIWGAQLYYIMLQACKFDNGFACSEVNGQCNFMSETDVNSIANIQYLLFAKKGVRLKQWESAVDLCVYYTRVEVDSIKAREAKRMARLYMPRPEIVSEELINFEVNSYMNSEWQKDRDKPHIAETFSPPANHNNFDHTIDGCMESIYIDGNIQAYEELINKARHDIQHPYTFYECLSICMMMANQYSYEPAFGHVREILLSFYPGQPIEEMDELTQQLIQLYTRPWMEPLPHCPQLGSEQTDMH